MPPCPAIRTRSYQWLLSTFTSRQLRRFLQAMSAPASYESSSRGLLNHYIRGSDDTIQAQSLWFFEAPLAFHGHHGIAYGGSLNFVMSSFHGDFSVEKLNTGIGSSSLHLVEIFCASCDVNKGVTIAFPLAKTKAFTGATTSYSLSLRETAGWVKDPKNSLVTWSTPSRCDFIEVLMV